MLDLLISLLQEASEAVWDTTLPPELCRAILIRWGGMRSAAANAVSRVDLLQHALGLKFTFTRLVLDISADMRSQFALDDVGVARLRACRALFRGVPSWDRVAICEAHKDPDDPWPWAPR